MEYHARILIKSDEFYGFHVLLLENVENTNNLKYKINHRKLTVSVTLLSLHSARKNSPYHSSKNRPPIFQ